MKKSSKLQKKDNDEILFSILTDITAAKTTAELLKTIFSKLNKVIDFDDVGLFQVLEDGRHRDLAVVTNSNYGANRKIKQNLPTEWLKPEESFNAILDKVQINLLSDFFSSYPNHPHLEFLKREKLKQFISSPLERNGETFGVFMLWSKNENKYTTKDISLFNKITDFIAVALSNILDRENLAIEKNFKETLLAVSESIASIHDRKELLKVIFEKINPIIPIDDVGLLILDDTGTKWKDLAVLDNYHQTMGGKELAALGFTEFLPLDKLTKMSIEHTGIITIEEMIENYSENPFVPIMVKDLKEFLYTPLKVGNTIIGSLFFDSEKSGVYNEGQLPLFKAIADQLAVAVSNVLTTERLLKEKHFKETLLSISEAVSNVQNRDQLLNVIIDKIQSVIPFDNSGLFVIDKKKDIFYELFTENAVNVFTEVPDLSSLSGPFPFSGNHKDAFIYLEEVGVYDALEQSKIYDNPQWDYLLKYGLKKLLVAPLIYGKEQIGFLCLNSKTENLYYNNIFPLMKAISGQVSIAVNNVLSNEKLVAEKNFSTTLLGITESVAQVKDCNDLYRTIFENIKPVFAYDEFGLFVFNEDKNEHYELITSENMHKSKAQKLIEDKLGINRVFKHEGTSVEWLVDNGPLYISIIEVAQKATHPQHKYMLEAGLKNLIGGPLTVAGKNFGMLCFTSYQDNFYKDEHLILFKSIAEQISIAVSNILSNQKIIEREKEKSILLGITSGVSKIRNLPDFLSFVTKQLKPIFKFVDVGIFLLTDNGKYHYDMAGADDAIFTSEINDALVADGNKKVVHKDSVIQWMMEKIVLEEGPVLFDFIQLANDFPDYYQFRLVDMPSSGYRDCLAANLIIGNSIFGMFCINALEKDFFKKEQFSLFQSVTEQLSVSISNILSNQQMQNEKKFSEILLEITEALSRAEDAVQLYNAIDNVVKKLIPFDQVGVLILDKSKMYHYELINENLVNQISESRIGLSDKQRLYEHKGTSVEWLANNGPVVTTMDFLVKKTKHPRHSDMVNVGIKELLGGPLIDEGKPIGMLAFKLKQGNVFNEQHVKHYKSVAEQVSICVANILSKKEILWKSSVQDLELNISNILTREDLSNEKWADIFQELKGLIPFTFAIVYKSTNNVTDHYTYEWLTHKEKRQLSTENIIEITKLSSSELGQMNKALIKMASKDDVDLNNSRISSEVRNFMKALGFQSVLPHKTNLNKRNTEVCFFMFSKNPEQYSIRHFNILKGINNTLRLSLENMFSSFAIRELSEQLQLEKTYLESVVKEAYNFEHMIGESQAIREVFSQIREVAGVNATTLLLGETGTGKELIARAIHENSDRKDRVLVKVNCAAIPSQIVESELFGHKRGAFTGAIQDRVGKFELANNGTIFLDEIGEMPLELQTKLLRVIQEREVERLGSNDIIKLDIRIIAATNKDLIKEIENGKFRSDLYYRLNGFPINVPPLRARNEDVLLLSDFFARQFSERYGLPFKGFTANSLSRLKRYDWPGNVRELQNLMEQAIISQRGKVLEVYPGSTGGPNLSWNEHSTSASSSLVIPENFDMETIKQEKDKLERAYILQALEKTNWRVSGKNGAARLLDVASTTLESKMKKLGIERNTI